MSVDVRRLCAVVLAAVLAMIAPTLSQAQAGGTPVVQPLPSAEAKQLSAALSRLGSDPRDINALVDAGNAASAMGDYEAAIGFFKRGKQIAGADARVLAGLAGALVSNADPVPAIPLFARAELAGALPVKIAAKRGLAYDLVGEPATAQRYYMAALSGGRDDEVTRRLAVSQAISGNANGMERTLLPLLRKQDKAAWRARQGNLLNKLLTLLYFSESVL